MKLLQKTRSSSLIICLDVIPQIFWGLCIDTGHANLVGGNEFIKLLATRYADRFFCQHLHDNRGWGKEDGCGDAHRLPGECSIDWKRNHEACPGVRLRAAFRDGSFQAGRGRLRTLLKSAPMKLAFGWQIYRIDKDCLEMGELYALCGRRNAVSFADS